MRQGCLLAPILFKTCNRLGNDGDDGDNLFWNIVGEAMITDLNFSDDVVILAETMEVLVHALDTLSTESEPLGLNFSWIKTNILKFIAHFDGNINPPPPMTVLVEYVSYVAALCTLGVLLRAGDDLSWQ